jgi:hypothetical protein
LFPEPIPLYYHPFVTSYPQHMVAAHPSFLHQGLPFPPVPPSHTLVERYERIRPKVPGTTCAGSTLSHYPIAPGRASSSSPPPYSHLKGPGLGVKDDRELLRKVSHSAIERRRRERINDKIMEIKAIVPSCSHRDNVHKFSILQSAISYIEKLQLFVSDVVKVAGASSEVSKERAEDVTQRLKELSQRGNGLLRKESSPPRNASKGHGESSWGQVPIAPRKPSLTSPPMSSYIGMLANKRDAPPNVLFAPPPVITLSRPSSHLVPIKPAEPLPHPPMSTPKPRLYPAFATSATALSQEKRLNPITKRNAAALDTESSMKGTSHLPPFKKLVRKLEPQSELDGLASDTLLMLSNSGSQTPSPPSASPSSSISSCVSCSSDEIQDQPERSVSNPNVKTETIIHTTAINDSENGHDEQQGMTPTH